MPRMYNSEFFARLLSRKSGRKVCVSQVDWSIFEAKMKKTSDSNELKGSLLQLGSITKDSLDRLECSIENLRDTINNRFDGLLGMSQQGGLPKDSISAGFEDLMHKRAQILFPGREIQRNVLLTRPYLRKGGHVKQLQIGEINILITKPNIIIEASLSLRKSDLERVIEKKLQLATMLSIEPDSISAEYWILWADSELEQKLKQDADYMGIGLVIGEDLLLINGKPI